LRPTQCEALPLILDGQQDVVITAPTGSGKTEAAFLPLISRLWDNGGRGVVLYVAPVKALINDQEKRLGLMCERMNIPVFPWHGDIGQTGRKRFLAAPKGLVLITPESLESLLFRKGSELPRLFGTLLAVVVDELHAFIGSERGRQLQSLLCRMEARIGRQVQRIGLSATLGDMKLAADFLRTGEAVSVRIVNSPPDSSDKKRIKLSLKAVCHETDAHHIIAAELFERLRSANYLVFPNTTGMVEFYADALRRRCKAVGLPETFFPHHGRLSKNERENTEDKLKRGNLPVSAICTTTLEVGIDIGDIRGVVQIGAPASAASLCQRIGRAGRRAGASAILLQYCAVKEQPDAPDCVRGLYPDLLQAIAVTRLFLAKWFEPPDKSALHYSTLVQQILSLIGERHGLTAAEAYKTLCLSGPFRNVSEADFIELLRGLCAHGLIVQDANRLLLHGAEGEKRVNRFGFFAAFPDTVEYRLRHNGKELGTLPLNHRHTAGELLVFAGERWWIDKIDHDKRKVELAPSTSGELPKTGGGSTPVHDRVREEMRNLLAGNDCPGWLDTQARSLLRAARRMYLELGLNTNRIVPGSDKFQMFVWRGDRTQDALVALLRANGVNAANCGIHTEISDSSPEYMKKTMAKIAASPCPSPAGILSRGAVGNPEKWDWALPDRLFYESFTSSRLDLAAAHALCRAG